MTILNVSISPERALVAVDVAGTMPGATQPLRMSKLIPFVHSNVVIAGRGNYGVMLGRSFSWQTSKATSITSPRSWPR
jgi:hypothetical protein